MKSRWYEYKNQAVALRESGMSIKSIELKLGIPRSTLSGWFKDIKLTPEQRKKLENSRKVGLTYARHKANESHRIQKTLRIIQARADAEKSLEQLPLSNAVLELALAMLYLGEGNKGKSPGVASSDPKILKFVVTVLKKSYQMLPSSIHCDLHLRMDQDVNALKRYWSKELGIPLERFGYVSKDRRTEGRPTYEHYKGVCVLYFGVNIQRRLMYLYNLFCEKAANLSEGV